VAFQAPEGGQTEAREFTLEFADVVLAESKIVGQVAGARLIIRGYLIDFLLEGLLHGQAVAAQLLQALQQLIEVVALEYEVHGSSSPGRTRGAGRETSRAARARGVQSGQWSEGSAVKAEP